MDILKAFAITIASAIFFALVGAGIGMALGIAVPDYYRTVFRIPPDVALNPIHTGLGLGFAQGFGAGLVVGLVIVVTVAWYKVRMASIANDRLRVEMM